MPIAKHIVVYYGDHFINHWIESHSGALFSALILLSLLSILFRPKKNDEDRVTVDEMKDMLSILYEKTLNCESWLLKDHQELKHSGLFLRCSRCASDLAFAKTVRSKLHELNVEVDEFGKLKIRFPDVDLAEPDQKRPQTNGAPETTAPIRR